MKWRFKMYRINIYLICEYATRIVQKLVLLLFIILQFRPSAQQIKNRSLETGAVFMFFKKRYFYPQMAFKELRQVDFVIIFI